MKKLIPLVGLGALTAYGLTWAHNWVHTALVDRSFTVPEALGKAVSESDFSDLAEKATEAKAWLKKQDLERHYIVNDDGYKLTGYLLKAKNPSNVYVFGSHGYRSDGKSEWCYFAQYYLNELGFNVFFVDHQAAGESEGGKIGFGSFESRDCLKWLTYLTDTFGKDIQIILHGISMGSATVMLITGNDALPENVKFTIADCGYTSALDEFNYKLKALNFPRKPLVPIICAMNRSRIGYDFQKDTDALGAIKKAKVPVLFVHGDKDKFVPTYMVYQLYDACPTEKELFVVPGADHAKSYLVDTVGYQEKIRNFCDRFIEK